LGLTVAKYVKERGFDAYGYASSTKAIDRSEKIAEIKHGVDFGTEDFDVFIISVSTHQPDDIFSPQIDGLLSTADKISKEAKIDGTLLSLDSTIQKGTSKKVFEILSILRQSITCYFFQNSQRCYHFHSLNSELLLRHRIGFIILCYFSRLCLFFLCQSCD
jgi:UDP-N-acetyl-D-mannosaminuronate dehydrogenase